MKRKGDFIEKKSVTGWNLGPIDISASGTTLIPAMCIPVRGVGNSQRIGNQLVVTDIYLNVIAYPKPDTQSDVMRIMVVIDKNPTSPVLPPTDLVTNVGTLGFIRSSITERFIVLLDKRYTVHSFTKSSTDNTYTILNRNMELNYEIPIQYKDNNGDAGDVSTNNIICYAYSEFGNLYAKLGYRVFYSDN